MKTEKHITKPAIDVPSTKPPRDDSTLRTGVNFVVASAVVALILAARFATAAQAAGLASIGFETVRLAAMVVAALPLPWSVVRLILAVSGRRRAVLRFFTNAGSSFAAYFMAWAASIGVFEAGMGLSLATFPLAAGAVGIMYWNRARTLVPALVLPAAGLGVALYLHGYLTPERVETLILGTATALAFARLVRHETRPSEDRLKTLEAENEQLWKLSFRDALTGLYNRRFANETGITLFTRAARYREQLHVIMIDIDHFKKVNDALSHAVGDEVLKGVAEVILSSIRSSDTASRYGGEEFLVYIIRADPELVQFIANRIRDGVAARRFEQVPWKITVSAGIAGIQENDTLESLIDRSDKFLYQSKRTGRNRVSGF